MPEIPNFQEVFIRQRRSLIVVSFVLLFQQTAGLTIDKINVFGNEGTLKDPSSLGWFLWVAWFYFLVRYFQYLVAIPNKGFADIFKARMKVLVTEAAERRFPRTFKPAPDLVERLSEPYRLEIKRMTPHTRKSWRWGIRIEANVISEVSGQRELYEIDHFGMKWRHLAIPQVRSLFYIGLVSRSFTEFALPFIVALLPLAVTLCSPLKEAALIFEAAPSA